MSECDEHDRCTERDKAECEWCMEEATTPANPTDQIAATTATRGDIASHEGDATTTAVVQDAQRYDRRSDPRANGALAALTDALRKEADHDRA